MAAAVDAVTGTLETETATLAELTQFIKLATQHLERAGDPHELAVEVEQAAPKFAVLNSFLRDNPHWVVILGVMVNILLAITNRPQPTSTPPPAVTVIVTPPDHAEVDRIIDEKLEPAGHRPGTSMPVTQRPSHPADQGSSDYRGQVNW